MRLTVILLCCLAIGQAADVTSPSRSTQKQTEELKTEKRALTEGNAGVQKRAPINVTPTPGIEYADSKPPQVAEKSPSQQIYATPVPQLAKISDVLTGQGLTFPSAIASHLFSPVSVYQSRLGSPTTYEVSQPVPSQLAYAEHKVYQPAQQNSVQYYGAQQKQAKSDQLARLVYNQPAPPQLFFQPQQVLYSQQNQPQPQLYQQQHLVQPQQVYTQQQTQVPQQAIFQYQFPAPPAAYNQVKQQQVPYAPQGPVAFTQNQVQQPFGYNQPNNQAPLIQLLPPQPIQYARQQQVPLNYQQQPQTYHQNQAPQYQQLPQAPQQYQQQPQQLQNYQQPQQVPLNIQVQQQHYQAQQHQVPVQRELKNVQAPAKVLEKQTLAPQPNFNDKQAGAVSYASFSQAQPSPNQITNQYQPKENKPQQQHVIYVKNQIAPQNYQPQQQQPIPQLPAHQAPVQQLPVNQLPVHQLPVNQLQAQQFHQQPYSQGQGVIVQGQGFQGGYVQQPLPVAPTFAPVQYFGKFAQSIFGYPQQHQ